VLLSGQAALLVGAGPGLGRDIAVRLAENGCDVALGARRLAVLEDVAADVKATGARVVHAVADVTVPGAAAALVDLAVRSFGRLDLLVYNAFRAGERWAEVSAADLDDWHGSMEVNFWGALRAIQPAVAAMRAGGGGRIVVIGSMSQRMVSAPGRGIYAASKAALTQIVRNLAVEVAPDGIRVNAVLPGWMAGPTVDALRTTAPSLVDRALAQIPLGHMPTSYEVAGSVVFFASDLSAPVTGQCLDVNGGQYLHP
jgi:NAD(P)-dependent dehydrogenase (short-subunit alcohol dehydrogenase family)